VGRRLAIKLLNAAKFVLSTPEPRGPIVARVDRGLLTQLARLVREATEDLEAYDYARALERTETFFWFFCDDYIELVKSRRNGAQTPALAASANATLLEALSTLLRLFALYLPFAAEEVWSWWRTGSVHAAAWPKVDELTRAIGAGDAASDAAAATGATDEDALMLAAGILGELRRRKSEQQKPLRTPVVRATVTDTAERIALMPAVADDLRAAGFIQTLDWVAGDAFSVSAELGEPEPAPSTPPASPASSTSPASPTSPTPVAARTALPSPPSSAEADASRDAADGAGPGARDAETSVGEPRS